MRKLVLTVIAALTLGGASSEAAEPTLLSNEDERSSVAAYRDWAVWSRYDATSGRYLLVAARGAQAPAVMPVRSRSVLFDVDLGPDTDGAPVAVYSRCQREVRRLVWNAGFFPPPYRLGRGCLIYKLDLETGRERRVLRRRGHSLVEPSIWRGTLAVVVQGTRKSDVHVAKVTRKRGKTRFQRIRAGRRPATEDTFGGPTGLDLTRGALAISWRNFADRRCPDDSDGMTSARTQIILVTSRRTKEVDRGCDLNPRYARGVIEVGWPTFSDARLSWARTVSERGSAIVGRSLSGSDRFSVQVDEFAINGAAVDDGRAVISASDNRIVAFDIPAWDR